MHSFAVQLAPILAAEKSKVPFYVAGGLLVAWALLLSLLLGMRRPDFPRSLQEQRGVVAITAVLVLAALVTAIVTSGGSVEKSEVAQTTTTAPESPPPSTATTPTATTGTTTSTPTATTGTPTPPSSPAAPSSLSLAADPAGALAYDPKQLSAKAGKVTITMTNASPVGHNVAIAEGTKVLGATPVFTGGSKKLEVTLKPGRYTFYCSVPGHRAAGMEGTLTVS
ncbi:MAG TPA: plastocyanin/azurin family copper-binding protein [Solirubrobacteraceae bacterium]|nr:plastocyanin/azurin family copper-binding protein [Solirubrobacteraceae bacterium]